MQPLATPFAVQELVDHCIDFLHDSRAALTACALVSQSWVYAAQRHLFAEVHLPSQATGIAQTERSWARFKDIIHRSPHLIRAIHRLHINATYFSYTSLSDICGLPFTGLTCVVFKMKTLITDPRATALQQLFSVPSLRRVQLNGIYVTQAAWLTIWEQFSPTIKHLELSCTGHSSHTFDPLPVGRAPIVLISLRITRLPVTGWVKNSFHGLKVLSLGPEAKVAWSEFAPVSHTLQALDIVITTYSKAASSTFDLASFPKLSLLRIAMPAYGDAALRTLSSLTNIVSPNHTRIIIHSIRSWAYYHVDSHFSGLPVPTVKLEMSVVEYERTKSSFPRLNSKNMLQRTDPVSNWFESFTDEFPTTTTPLIHGLSLKEISILTEE
ncbi:hypothetical protein C8F04DRAFT_1108129 [Mycena alexandri]|uniref:F-box domain-containing protein n=1 Tax=Mycena alexandri TaxID=1745969 RepID=A0AAD6SQM0_9AGAR|nr:hypothetical protein C8F04DRAFT_1108129 [Mycena alexandri]